MKQHSGAFPIVNRKIEKILVERHDLERKVSGGVGVAMANIPVPPIIRATENHGVFENEGLSIKALLLQNCDRLLNLLPLIGLKSVRTHQKRDIPDSQNDQRCRKNPDYSFEKASFSGLLTFCDFFGIELLLIGERSSATSAQFV